MGLIGVTIVSHKVARTGRERRTPATRGVVTDHIAQAFQSWEKDMSFSMVIHIESLCTHIIKISDKGNGPEKRPCY